MIYFDLDGVIRDLCAVVFGREAQQWNELTSCGKNLPQFINDNPEVLCDAPMLPYEQVLCGLYMRECPVHILTAQRMDWMAYTFDWIWKNLPYIHIEKDLTIVPNPEYKLKVLKDGDILIDDHPIYENCKQVITVDHPYNRHITAYDRVYNYTELWNAIMNRVHYA